MVKISIACLIYKSTKWLQFVYDQVIKHTNMNDNEFYFIANDACPEVLEYLKNNNIPHYIHNNTENQKKEWYINNVYRAYNTAGRMSKGDYIVFINSDMAFNTGWLDILINNIDDTKVISSRLVERGILRSGKYGIERNFGNIPSDYDEKSFIEYIDTIKEEKIMEGGLYMPILVKREHFESVGGYPEGNIIYGSDIYNPEYAIPGQKLISGDAIFITKLKNKLGVNHWTSFSSIVYHFQEGEKRDN